MSEPPLLELVEVTHTNLLELLQDTHTHLRSTREFIRLPVNYHPDLAWRMGRDRLYYRSGLFKDLRDLTGQPPRDISALKIDAVVEERMLVHEMEEIRIRFCMLKKDIPSITLGQAATQVTRKRKSVHEDAPKKLAKK